MLYFKGMTHPKLHTIQSIALAAAIIIVLNLFINFGVRAFYKAPAYEDFCPAEKANRAYEDKAACETVGGLWYEPGSQGSPHGPYPVRPSPLKGEIEEPKGWCDAYFTCNKEFQEASSVYNRNVFIVLVIAGLIALMAGFLVRQSAAVSSGLIFGGVLSFIVGTVRYWSDMQEYLRFVILGIALAVLLWIGIRKLKR